MGLRHGAERATKNCVLSRHADQIGKDQCPLLRNNLLLAEWPPDLCVSYDRVGLSHSKSCYLYKLEETSITEMKQANAPRLVAQSRRSSASSCYCGSYNNLYCTT